MLTSVVSLFGGSDLQAGVDLLLVLQTVFAALHVHLLGVGVVELALTQLACK